jgi:hypothetical protein
LLFAAILDIFPILSQTSRPVELTTTEGNFRGRFSLLSPYPHFVIPVLGFLVSHPSIFLEVTAAPAFSPELSSAIVRHSGKCFATEDAKVEFLIKCADHWGPFPEVELVFDIDCEMISELNAYRLLTHPRAGDLERWVSSFQIVRLHNRIQRDIRSESAEKRAILDDLQHTFSQLMADCSQRAQEREALSGALLIADHHSAAAAERMKQMRAVLYECEAELVKLETATKDYIEGTEILDRMQVISARTLDRLQSLSSLRSLFYPESGPNSLKAMKTLDEVAIYMNQALKHGTAPLEVVATVVHRVREMEQSLSALIAER